MSFFSFRRSGVVVLILCLMMAPLVSCGGVPEPLKLTNLNLGIPAPAMNSPVVGSLNENKELHVRITFKMNPNLLKQTDGQPIQPAQRSRLQNFANKLGIDDATYQKIKSFFSVQGIALKLSKLRTHLAVDAKAKTLAKLLQTSFVLHKFNDRTFYAPATPPKVPQFLVQYIDAITGLDNYSARPEHQSTLPVTPTIVPQQPAVPSQDCSPQGDVLLPREIAHAYGFDKLWDQGLHGENMTVNLVEIDGSYRDDIQNYLDCINFKGKFSIINVNGKPRDALGESTLDVEMIAGLARSINIAVYQTDGDADEDVWVLVNDELQRILDDNADKGDTGNVVSVSLGTAEREISADDVRAIDSSLQQLTRVEHMTVFIASGDCGAYTSRVFGELAVAFPASDPWAVSVGGTMLAIDRNSNRGEEVVWADPSNRSSCKNRWGSGGGNSEIFKHPGWQQAAGVENRFSRGVRQLPDISAVAFGLAVFFEGRWGSVGGTSAAAPIWATGLALVNQGLLHETGRFAYGPQLFYLVQNKNPGLRPYFDITQGDNLYYPATPGWDFASGLGTPNLVDFYQVLRANAPKGK